MFSAGFPSLYREAIIKTVAHLCIKCAIIIGLRFSIKPQREVNLPCINIVNRSAVLGEHTPNLLVKLFQKLILLRHKSLESIEIHVIVLLHGNREKTILLLIIVSLVHTDFLSWFRVFLLIEFYNKPLDILGLLC